MVPCWPLSQRLKSPFMQIVETWSLKCRMAQIDRQNGKFPPILIITKAKNAHFFVRKRTGFVHQEPVVYCTGSGFGVQSGRILLIIFWIGLDIISVSTGSGTGFSKWKNCGHAKNLIWNNSCIKEKYDISKSYYQAKIFFSCFSR